MNELPHLIRRFFGSLVSRPLGPREQDDAGRLLRPAEAALFWSQQSLDQRHGLECARRAAEAAPGRTDLSRAALLHDVGKRHAGLGVVARMLATGLGLLHLPARGRLEIYLDHGPRGAADLEAAGSDPLTVAFARHHHTGRPDLIPIDDWDVLQRADGH
jgi:hypothetical protein